MLFYYLLDVDSVVEPTIETIELTLSPSFARFLAHLVNALIFHAAGLAFCLMTNVRR